MNTAFAAWSAVCLLGGCTTYETLPPRTEPFRPGPESTAGSSKAGTTAAASEPSLAQKPAGPADLSKSWVGTWDYFDQGPKIGMLVASVGHSLDVRPDRTARYTATGYQADAEVECDVEEAGDTLRVIARRNTPGGDGQPRMLTHTPGKLLLVLQRERGVVTTRWEDAVPGFEGCASGKVCFKKDKLVYCLPHKNRPEPISRFRASAAPCPRADQVGVYV